MKKREIFLLSSTVFSLGIVLGFLISPIKQGMNFYGSDVITKNYGNNDSASEDDNNIQE